MEAKRSAAFGGGSFCLLQFGLLQADLKMSKIVRAVFSQSAKNLDFSSKIAYKKNQGFFSENPAVWSFLYFGPLTPCKVSEKSLEPIPKSIRAGAQLTLRIVSNTPPCQCFPSKHDICCFLDMWSFVNVQRQFKLHKSKKKSILTKVAIFGGL